MFCVDRSSPLACYEEARRWFAIAKTLTGRDQSDAAATARRYWAWAKAAEDAIYATYGREY